MKLREINIKFPDGSIHTIQVYAVNRTSTGEYIMSYYEVAVNGVPLEKPEDCFTPIKNENGVWYKDPIHREWNEYDIIDDPEFSERFISVSLQEGMVMGSLAKKPNQQNANQQTMAASNPPFPPPPPSEKEMEEKYIKLQRKYQELIANKGMKKEIPLDLVFVKHTVENFRDENGKPMDVSAVFVINSKYEPELNGMSYDFVNLEELEHPELLKEDIRQLARNINEYKSGIFMLNNNTTIKYNAGCVRCQNADLFNLIYNAVSIGTIENAMSHIGPIESLSRAVNYESLLMGMDRNYELFSNGVGVGLDGMTVIGKTPRR